MMTPERFNNLTLPQQCYYAIKCGVYLASLTERSQSSDLYQCGNFYIELYYEHGSYDCRFAFAFSHLAHLNRYLEMISIEELL